MRVQHIISLLWHHGHNIYVTASPFTTNTKVQKMLEKKCLSLNLEPKPEKVVSSLLCQQNILLEKEALSKHFILE